MLPTWRDPTRERAPTRTGADDNDVVEFVHVQIGSRARTRLFRARLPGVARIIVFLFLALAGILHAGNVEVTSIETTVADLPRACAFYIDVLQFTLTPVSKEREGDSAALHLGQETLILFKPKTKGRPVPSAMPSNDRLFQHVAIVVSDMDAAYRRLIERGVKIVSVGPQTLPRWNFDAAGIRSLYFHDPDGHFIELIQFPSNKGEPKWQCRDGRLFLGIDHTAIIVRDMKASRHFYRDLLGLTIVGESLNYGGEQESLTRVPGARVKITGLRGAKGPGIELLQYIQPGTAETFPGDPMLGDSLYWQINLSAQRIGSWETGTLRRDLDGHALCFAARASDVSPFELMREALRQHWSRYLMEGAELGIFMIVALYLTIALEHPDSPIHRAIASKLLRRFLMGAGIGITVVVLIYCQWGRQSGAQFNPAVTLARLSLGRIEPWDAVFYIIAQFLGGWLLLVLAALPLRRAARHEKVKYVVTEPGPQGVLAAFAAEFLISFILLFLLLQIFHQPALKPFIGLVAGVLLTVYITFEAPFSGMSLSPARSVASAIPARSWKAIWIYFVAPPLAMLLAARLCRRWIDS